jgi:hypothetical protein
MMNAFQIGYGNPNQYADWTKYAGLDKNTGMMGIAPPDQSSGNLADNLSGAASELQQGNLVNALRTFQYGKKPGIPPAPSIQPIGTQQPEPSAFQYTHQWDD